MALDSLANLSLSRTDQPSASEWKTVHRPRRNRRPTNRRAANPSSPRPHPINEEPIRPLPESPSEIAETLSSLTRSYGKICQDEALQARIKQQVDSTIGRPIRDHQLEVNRVLVLGLGSLSHGAEATGGRTRPLLQLAVAEAIWHAVAAEWCARGEEVQSQANEEAGRRSLELIFADPAFRRSDVQFLGALDLRHLLAVSSYEGSVVCISATPQILDSGESSIPQLGRKTLLFAPHLPHKILLQLLTSEAPRQSPLNPRAEFPFAQSPHACLSSAEIGRRVPAMLICSDLEAIRELSTKINLMDWNEAWRQRVEMLLPVFSQRERENADCGLEEERRKGMQLEVEGEVEKGRWCSGQCVYFRALER